MPRENPFRPMVAGLSSGDFALLSSAVDERRCREDVGFGTFAEAAALYRPDPPCPSCGSASTWNDGLTDAGLQRLVCRECGRRYNSLTGTVLERSKPDMPTWVRFVRLMRLDVPLDAIAEVCGITHQTAWDWRHRLFEAVDGYQDRLVLRDRVWLDELWQACHNSSHEKREVMRSGGRSRWWAAPTAPAFFP